MVAEVRSRLLEAASARERGDVPGALAIIGQAMERLAGLASHLDAAEGAIMHTIAASFAQALSAGDKGTVYVVRDGQAHAVAVSLGEDSGLRVAVLKGTDIDQPRNHVRSRSHLSDPASDARRPG